MTQCNTVVIDAPPVVDPGGPYSGLQGVPVDLAGTVTDPDGPDLAALWTYGPATGVNPTATCSFGDPESPSTTVTCTQNGVYTLILTANDGVRPPVAASTTLTVANAPPQVSAGGPYVGTAGSSVALAGAVTDPDGPELVTAWTAQPDLAHPNATCAFTDATAQTTLVTCPEPGTYLLTLTADDG